MTHQSESNPSNSDAEPQDLADLEEVKDSGGGMVGDSQKEELEKDIEQFIRDERASRLRMAIFFTLGVLFFGVIGVLLFSTADKFLELPIDIEKGEQEVTDATNDPQCREFIAHVEKIGAQYREYVGGLTQLLQIDKVPELQKIADRIGDFRRDLDVEKAFYPSANLRFDDSPDQLRKWFRYTDNELSILQDLALYRKQQLLDEEEKAAKADQKTEDGETVIILKKDKKNLVGADRIKSSKKSPEDLLEGSLLASQEAFETFRVWHTGGLHPCGAADPDETPWTSDAAAPKPQSQAAAQPKKTAPKE